MLKKMGIKFIWVFLFFMFLVSSVSGATYYISPTGDDTTGDGTDENPWATLHKAFGEMVGGDTLILKDGVYIGENNMMDNNHKLPIGSDDAYTIVKAENVGEAIIDGENVRVPVSISEVSYIVFEGIIFKSSSESVFSIIGGVGGSTYSHHIKILKCGFYDADNTPTKRANNIFFRYTNYILIEDSYTWGNGKYRFYILDSDHFILRRCVDRFDRGVDNEPWSNLASFRLYGSNNVILQNCISIDADTDFILRNRDGEILPADPKMIFLGGNPSTGNRARDNLIDGTIILNAAANGWIGLGGGYEDLNNTFRNSVFWGLNGSLWIRGDNTEKTVHISHSTFGNINYDGSFHDRAVESDREGIVEVYDSIIYDTGSDAFRNVYISNYNTLYGNYNNYAGSSTGENDYCSENENEFNPLNNGLVYLLRIEEGSTLDGVASDGEDIGATILKKIGVSGTLYGEIGFDQITNENLWPFPYEDIIKEKMSSYYYTDGVGEIRGDRGFAADGDSLYGGPITLTSYIWEYLGNECPPEICNYNISTCTDAGGTCQTNSCSTYQNCSSLTGTCSSGNCCFGTCTEIVCVDSDGDGYNVSQTGCGIADCNDSNPSIYPGAVEVCGNGVDEDCSGSDLVCNGSLVISGIIATPSSTSATVSWVTDELATSIVEYGLTTSYGNSEAVLSFVLSHLVSLTGLQSSTTYHYRVFSNDSAGNEAVSGDGVFTTTVETGGDDGEDSGGSSGGGSSGGGSSSAECVLTNAYWSVVSAREGEEVLLTVEGTDCEGEGIDLFVIWEDDLIGDDSVDVNPSTVDFLDGKAVASWTVEYQDDFFGEPEYYFISSLKSDSTVEIDSRDYCGLLRVVEAGFVKTGCPNYVWTGVR